MLRVGQSLFASFALGASIVAVLSGGCGTKPNGLQGDDLGGDDAAGGTSSGSSRWQQRQLGQRLGQHVRRQRRRRARRRAARACSVNMNCPGGGHTTISGTVFDPAGKNPLNNVVVFAPRDVTPLPQIPVGTNTCNTCDTPIGDYYAAAVSDPKGHFTLSDVPTGKHVPFVAQTGKWRYVFSRGHDGLRQHQRRQRRRPPPAEPHGRRHAADGPAHRQRRQPRLLPERHGHRVQRVLRARTRAVGSTSTRASGTARRG